MKARMHRRWTSRLSDYLDGGLDPVERARVEQHLERCASCTDVLEELRGLVTAAGRLRPVEPSRDLWPEIEAALGPGPHAAAASGGAPDAVGLGRAGRRERAEDVIELPTARKGRATTEAGGSRRRIALTAPQLAAAASVLVILSVATTRWAATPSPSPEGAEAAGGSALGFAAELPPPPETLAVELSALEEELAAARAALDANTLRVLERNLDVIERAIEDSRRALALDPGNEFLSQHLRQVYERKLDYLRQAASIVSWTD